MTIDDIDADRQQAATFAFSSAISDDHKLTSPMTEAYGWEGLVEWVKGMVSVVGLETSNKEKE